MKKILINIFLFISLFIFYDFKNVDSHQYKSLNREQNKMYEEDYHILKFNAMNVKSAILLLEKYSIDIIQIYPLNKECESIYFESYENTLKKYGEEINQVAYTLNNGFPIEMVKVLSNNDKLVKLEQELTYKLY